MDRKIAVLQIVRGTGESLTPAQPDPDENGPFEVRSANTNLAAARNRKHHTSGGVHSYSKCEDGPLLEPPVRRYDCENYETCLDLAAVFNWSSFSCGQCRGQVNERLKWRACQIQRKDSLARAVSDLPTLAHAVANSELTAAELDIDDDDL